VNEPKFNIGAWVKTKDGHRGIIASFYCPTTAYTVSYGNRLGSYREDELEIDVHPFAQADGDPGETFTRYEVPSNKV
jgi:hypothetical protein